MAKFESNLSLSTSNLNKRREQLETELNKVITEIVTQELKKLLTDALKDSEIKISRISWDFHSEYDDEGGTDWYPNSIQAFDEEGGDIDLEDILVEETSYDGSPYKVSLDYVINDVVIDYSSDLYDQCITEISL